MDREYSSGKNEFRDMTRRRGRRRGNCRRMSMGIVSSGGVDNFPLDEVFAAPGSLPQRTAGSCELIRHI
jgi:hypothetical protein